MEEPNNLEVHKCSMFPRNLDWDFYHLRLPMIVSCKEDLLTMPPGILFVPTDVELIKFYLRKKIMNEELPVNQIYEVPVYEYHPEELTAKYKLERGREWYFFTTMKRKYPRGSRPSRSASKGYWKPTGTDKAIKDNGQTIGFRKSLDFYEGKHYQGEKSKWKMHEYKLEKMNFSERSAHHAQMNGGVLCKIYENDRKKNEDSDLENENDEDTDVSSDEISVVPEIKEPDSQEPLVKDKFDAEMDIGTNDVNFDIDLDFEVRLLQQYVDPFDLGSNFDSNDGFSTL